MDACRRTACVLLDNDNHIPFNAVLVSVSIGTTACLLAHMQANGTGRRQCPPGVAIGTLMLPLVLWFGLDYLHLTPRPQPPKLEANPAAAKRFESAAPPPPPPLPPPPKPLEDWQLVSRRRVDRSA